MAAAIASAKRDLGRLDILVLNAGTWMGSPIPSTSEAEWDTLIDLNLKGAFLTLKHGLPHLIERGAGTVVGIGSIGGLVGQPGSAAYAASKWGLRGLLESAALEVKPHHIRVSVIYPHQINSGGRVDPRAPSAAASSRPRTSRAWWRSCARRRRTSPSGTSPSGRSTRGAGLHAMSLRG